MPNRIRRAAPPAFWLGLLVLLGSPGCAWLQQLTNRTPFSPFNPGTRQVAENASLAEVIAVVNRDPSRITSLKTTNASIHGRAGLLPIPSLQANIAIERPSRFRLVGELGTLGGQEVDLGSNDEMFWFWIKRNQPPAIYYSRHEEFARSSARQAWPIDPMWLIDAFGLATLDPTAQHSGPTPVGKGRLSITTSIPSGNQTWSKVSQIDVYLGQIVEQHVYDARGDLIASVAMSGHRADPVHNVQVPRHLELKWPSTGLVLKVNLGDVAVNQVEEPNPALFAMPTISGYQPVNLLEVQPQFGGRESAVQNVTTIDRRGETRSAARERSSLFQWMK